MLDSNWHSSSRATSISLEGTIIGERKPLWTCSNLKIALMNCRTHTSAREKNNGYVQDNRYDSQKLPVTSELTAIIHLLPPCELSIIALVFSERSPFLPVKESVRHLLNTPFNTTEYSVPVQKERKKRDFQSSLILMVNESTKIMNSKKTLNSNTPSVP